MPITRVLAATADAVREAAEVIRRGGLVAFPTETVYGLGANALDDAAVRRVFVAKERPADDPLIVHLASAADLAAVCARLPPDLADLARRFWPGPLTVVLPRGPAVPPSVTAGGETVAVRVPAHPVARSLIEAAERPIAAPSANRFARPSPTTAEHVLQDLDGRIDLVLDDGPTPLGVESTVLDLTGGQPRILRPGGVTAEQLQAVLGDRLAAPAVQTADRRSPGTAERHYSPRARLDLFDGPGAAAAVARRAAELAARGERVGVLAFAGDPVAVAPPPGVLVETLGPEDALDEAARRLYAALRALDARGVDAIVGRMPRPGGLGLALRDRLRRAASGRILGA
ncbi:MAG TPA: L-threonylcarbamoyladenylate synthase [Chloroflexota bacterium]|jgi:L-threonylcarbamoyladenylate synthase|nr:L-threonylcarbamoyladenylate synthase [Chloroflexota bacterium]